MAFVDQSAHFTTGRTAAIVTVAGLHGMALFGLITGLGATYVAENVPMFSVKSIKADPPPPEEPPPQPRATAKPDNVITAPVVTRPLPPPRDAFIIDSRPPLPPLGDTAGSDRLIDLPGPTGTPPPFTPRTVRPRNDPAGWVTPADYPTAELRAGRQGTVQFEVTVGSDGKVRECRVTQSSGSTGLDDVTCRHIARRARFEAATDGFGAKVDGTYTGRIRWVIPTD